MPQKIAIGTAVIFVPGHDQEYKNKAQVGKVHSYDEKLDKYTTLVIKNDTAYFYNSIPSNFIADVSDIEQIVRLVQYLTQREIDLLSMLYRIDLLTYFDKEISHKELHELTYYKDRYHIN